MKALSIILIVLASIYLLICVLMYFLQEKILFFPELLEEDAVFSFQNSPEPEEIWIEAPDARLHGLLFSADSARGVILYFHGNAGSLLGWGEVAGELSQYGYHVLAMDYRGYGKSRGPMSEAALRSDALLAFDELQKRFQDLPILVFGRSLGSGLAVEVASKRPLSRLLLETPYVSIRSRAAELYPWLPTSLLLRYPMDNEPLLANINIPVHIIHGTADQVIPSSHSQKLSERLTHTDIHLKIITGGQHNDLAAFPEYHPWLIQALQ